MNADELVDQILDLMRKKPGYRVDAYIFVFQALNLAVSKLSERGHISCKQLVDAYVDLAVEDFGYLASEVFKRWDVFTARDVGHLVFNLIDAKLLQAQAGDKLTDFDEEYVLAPVLDVKALDAIGKAPIQ